MMASMVEKKEFKKYLSEAKTWETNRLVEAEKSKKIAWTVAIGASVIAFVSTIAIAGLTPLKTVELRIVRVNDTTGTVDVLSELSTAKTTYGKAIDKYFAGQYIRFREGYSRQLAEEYYSKVGLMSASQEQKRYGEWFNPKNPESPLRVYGENGKSKVNIKSYSFIKDNIVLVRYSQEVERSATEKPEVTHWAATMVFKYSGAPMTEKDRDVNPLGFQVTEYRRDPDSAATTEVAPRVAVNQTVAPQNRPVILPGVASQEQVPAIAPATNQR
jgi:type IV secretion system protein VirB8